MTSRVQFSRLNSFRFPSWGEKMPLYGLAAKTTPTLSSALPRLYRGLPYSSTVSPAATSRSSYKKIAIGGGLVSVVGGCLYFFNPRHKDRRIKLVALPSSSTADEKEYKLEANYTRLREEFKNPDSKVARKICEKIEKIRVLVLERCNEDEPNATVFKQCSKDEPCFTLFPCLKNLKILVITGAHQLKDTDFLKETPRLEVLVLTGAHEIEYIPRDHLPALKELTLTGAEKYKDLESIS